MSTRPTTTYTATQARVIAAGCLAIGALSALLVLIVFSAVAGAGVPVAHCDPATVTYERLPGRADQPYDRTTRDAVWGDSTHTPLGPTITLTLDAPPVSVPPGAAYIGVWDPTGELVWLPLHCQALPPPPPAPAATLAVAPPPPAVSSPTIVTVTTAAAAAPDAASTSTTTTAGDEAQAVDIGTSATYSRELPATGRDTASLLALGLALLTIGAALLWVARR